MILYLDPQGNTNRSWALRLQLPLLVGLFLRPRVQVGLSYHSFPEPALLLVLETTAFSAPFVTSRGLLVRVLPVLGIALVLFLLLAAAAAAAAPVPSCFPTTATCIVVYNKTHNPDLFVGIL